MLDNRFQSTEPEPDIGPDMHDLRTDAHRILLFEMTEKVSAALWRPLRPLALAPELSGIRKEARSEKRDSNLLCSGARSKFFGQ